MDRIAAGTSMGVVDLLVRNLDLMVAYYREGVGLDLLEEHAGAVTLGRGDARGEPIPIVRLTRESRLPDFHRGGAGLFHTAIRFNTRAGLAAALLSTARHAPTSFTGSADHLVSEAFYFDDPEGNGVELYVDRPRELWEYTAAGGVTMATLPLDPNAFLAAHLSGERGPEGADVGHVHLQVGNIAEAQHFYSGVLGFDVMARYGDQALFVAAGGYHHHLGLNTWNSAGAGPRAASLGLERLAIEVPGSEELERIGKRLAGAGIGAQRRRDDASPGARLLTTDPWGTRIEIRAGDG